MKFAILSRGPRLYSTRRLKEACVERGHRVRILNPLDFTIVVEPEAPSLLYKNRSIDHYDGVIPRIGASLTFFGTAVVRQFEQMGVHCLNSSAGISASRDKLRSVQILSRHRVGLARTAFVKRSDGILPAIDRVGGAPVVIKLLEGTQGIGVILADDVKIAEAIVETLQSTKQNVLIQDFVSESRGRDLRAFVVGNRVVAAMRRSAQGGEFRSNVHRGGRTEAVELDAEYERTAIQAARILDLDVAGVDMLETHKGPALMEVNSSPGLEGIEKATGVDVAGAIIDHLVEDLRVPEVDIRQRLRLASGYGVAEIPIGKRSELAGRTIAESGLRAMDVVVLNIIRDSVMIPNPKGVREILVGDTLLCFGKIATLSGLLPPRRRPRRKSPGKDGAVGSA